MKVTKKIMVTKVKGYTIENGQPKPVSVALIGRYTKASSIEKAVEKNVGKFMLDSFEQELKTYELDAIKFMEIASEVENVKEGNDQ